jgi:hypothetical protein
MPKMPNDLGDVLHYFIPEAGNPPEAVSAARSDRRRAAEPMRPAALPLIGLPIGEQDVVRAAFAWNLAFEITRLGARAAIVSPCGEESAALWPLEGAGGSSSGSEVFTTPATSLGALYRDALDLAVERAADADDGGLVLVRIPPKWLRRPNGGGSLLRWTLLFTSSEPRDLLEAYGLTKLLCSANRTPRVGVTIHGARRISEAETAFGHLAGSTARHLGHELTSYGLLVDDLHVYRAIVDKRPVGLVHPQSPAARCLRDVAMLLLSDARKIALV